VTETYHVVNIGRALAGQEPVSPKNGARFHFELPGSVQGFQAEESIEVKGTLSLENIAGHSRLGERSLAFHYRRLAPGRVARAATGTFIPSEEIAAYFDRRGYSLLASPTLYSGQVVRAAISADAGNDRPVACNLYSRVYGPDDRLVIVRGPRIELAPAAQHEFTWTLGDTGGSPIAEIGLEISSHKPASGTIYLDYLTWAGSPEVSFRRPDHNGNMWRRAWVNGLDQYDTRWPEAFRLAQNQGRGLLIQGTREWTDYRVKAALSPHLAEAAGIGARVQGMQRYYALLLRRPHRVCLIKALDGEQILAEADFPWHFGAVYELELQVTGNRLLAGIDGQPLFDVEDNHRPLTGGGIALICEEGRVATEVVTVRPVG
jgi:hypothetical protein